MITVENCSVNLGDFHLENINLSIKEREIFALIGETGAGKSILLESLAGFHIPVSGSVKYGDREISSIPLPSRNIGFVYQDYGLFPHMKVRENIEFGLKMHGIPRKERHIKSDYLMKSLKISHLSGRYPATLSGGEQQRTALARALALEPEVIFMDEPFSALDPGTKEKMYSLIRDIHEKFGCTIIFVTHDFNEAAVLADRIGVMIKGQLRKVCNSCDLFDGNDDEDVAGFLNAKNKNKKLA